MTYPKLDPKQFKTYPTKLVETSPKKDDKKQAFNRPGDHHVHWLTENLTNEYIPRWLDPTLDKPNKKRAGQELQKNLTYLWELITEIEEYDHEQRRPKTAAPKKPKTL